MDNHKISKLIIREVKMKKNIFKILFFIALFIVNVNAENKVITEADVKTFITNMSTKSNSILNNTEMTELQKETEYKNFTGEIVDSDYVARFILATNWRTLTVEQQQEFQTLYKEYLMENYIPKLKDYNQDLTVNKIEKLRDKVYIAQTTTKDKDGRLVNVNFRVIEKNGELYIIDIIPEGISFISSQRTDVNNSISKNGYNGFIKELKSKIKGNIE